MKYLTPTGLAEAGRVRDREERQIVRLGGVAALVEALPRGAYVVVENEQRREVVELVLGTFGRPADDLRFVLARHGYHALDLPQGTIIGVDENALAGAPTGDRNFRSMLSSKRFSKVLWA